MRVRLIRFMDSRFVSQFCIFLAVALTEFPASAEPLRLLSYNIHAGVGTDEKLDLERIAKIIEESEADIVALQEVDHTNKRSAGRDLASELGDLTGMQSIFGASMAYRGGHYGNAFLIREGGRWHLTATRRHTIPVPEEKEPRSVLEIELAGKSTSESSLTLFSSHWCNRVEANRLAAATFINSIVSRIDGTAILLGDLNATPASAPLRRLLDAGWRNPSPKEVPTIPTSSPSRQIDFILFQTSAEWKAITTTALNHPIASDHLPLLSVIDFEPTESKP